MSNQVGKSQKVGFPCLGPIIHNLHHPNHVFHCQVVECKFIFSLFIFALMQKLEIWHVVHFVIGRKLNV